MKRHYHLISKSLAALMVLALNLQTPIPLSAQTGGIDYFSAITALVPGMQSGAGRSLEEILRAGNGNLQDVNGALQNVIQHTLATNPARGAQLLETYQNTIRPLLESQHALTDSSSENNLGRFSGLLSTINPALGELATLLGGQEGSRGDEYIRDGNGNIIGAQSFAGGGRSFQATPQNVQRLIGIYQTLTGGQNTQSGAGGVSSGSTAERILSMGTALQNLTRSGGTNASRAAGFTSLLSAAGLDQRVTGPLSQMISLAAQGGTQSGQLGNSIGAITGGLPAITNHVGAMISSAVGGPIGGVLGGALSGAVQGRLNGQNIPIPGNLVQSLSGVQNAVAGALSGIPGVGNILSTGMANVAGNKTVQALAGGASPSPMGAGNQCSAQGGQGDSAGGAAGGAPGGGAAAGGANQAGAGGREQTVRERLIEERGIRIPESRAAAEADVDAFIAQQGLNPNAPASTVFGPDDTSSVAGSGTGTSGVRNVNTRNQPRGTNSTAAVGNLPTRQTAGTSVNTTNQPRGTGTTGGTFPTRTTAGTSVNTTNQPRTTTGSTGSFPNRTTNQVTNPSRGFTIPPRGAAPSVSDVDIMQLEGQVGSPGYRSYPAYYDGDILDLEGQSTPTARPAWEFTPESRSLVPSSEPAWGFGPESSPTRTLQQQLEDEFRRQLQQQNPVLNPGELIGLQSAPSENLAAEAAGPSAASIRAASAARTAATDGEALGRQYGEQFVNWFNNTSLVGDAFSAENLRNFGNATLNAAGGAVAGYVDGTGVMSGVRNAINTGQGLEAARTAINNNQAVQQALTSALGGGNGGKGVPTQEQNGPLLQNIQRIRKEAEAQTKLQQQMCEILRRFEKAKFQDDPEGYKKSTEAADKADEARLKLLAEKSVIKDVGKEIQKLTAEELARTNEKLKEAGACKLTQEAIDEQAQMINEMMKDRDTFFKETLKCVAGSDEAAKKVYANTKDTTALALALLSNPMNDPSFEQFRVLEEYQRKIKTLEGEGWTPIEIAGNNNMRSETEDAPADPAAPGSPAGGQSAGGAPKKKQVKTPGSVLSKLAAESLDRKTERASIAADTKEEGGDAAPKTQRDAEQISNFSGSGSQGGGQQGGGQQVGRGSSDWDIMDYLGVGLQVWCGVIKPSSSICQGDNQEEELPPVPDPVLAFVSATSTRYSTLVSGLSWSSQGITSCTYGNNWLTFGDGARAETAPVILRSAGASAPVARSLEVIFHPQAFAVTVDVYRGTTTVASQVAAFKTKVEKTYPAPGTTNKTRIRQETRYTPVVTGITGTNEEIEVTLDGIALTIRNLGETVRTPNGMAVIIRDIISALPASDSFKQITQAKQMTFRVEGSELVITGEKVFDGQMTDSATYELTCRAEKDGSEVKKNVILRFGKDTIE